MSFSIEKKKIGEGITLTKIIDTKFKSDLVSISFVTPLDKKNAPVNTLLQMLLSTSNEAVPSRTEMDMLLTELYVSTFSTTNNIVGDYQISGIYTEYLGDDFTIGREVVSDRIITLLLNSLLNPDLKEGKFKEKYVEHHKQELCDAIKNEKNNKRSYAIRQAKKLIYENEPASFSSYTTVEEVKNISQEDLFRQYEYLKKSAQIEIVLCGENFDRTEKMICDAMKNIERENVVKAQFRTFSKLKETPANQTDETEMKQSHIVMAYKSRYEDVYVAKLFSAMLGATPFSKLFTNVREKLSLCYSCSCGYLETKGTLLIYSGVDKENIEKAEQAISSQVEAMQNGDFSDEEFENTKIYLCRAFKSNYDSVFDMSDYFTAQNYRGTAFTPEEICDKFMSTTREQLVDCAKSFKQDTVYVLKSKSEVSAVE